MPAEDEAFARYGQALADAVERALGPWVAGAVERRLPPERRTPEVEARTGAAAAEAATEITARLRDLLALDLEDQWTNPLSIIRQAVVWPTAVLAEAGVPPVDRDDTEARLYPDDAYGLVPAAFADLGPDVHDAGLVWGAAKAHVHLRRRAAADRP